MYGSMHSCAAAIVKTGYIYYGSPHGNLLLGVLKTTPKKMIYIYIARKTYSAWYIMAPLQHHSKLLNTCLAVRLSLFLGRT